MEDETEELPAALPFVDRQAAIPAVPGQIGLEFATRRPGSHCPWPMWAAPAKTGMVCGLPSDPDHPRSDWCRHHRAFVYSRAVEEE